MGENMQIEDLVEVITDQVVKTLHQRGLLNYTRLRNEKIKIEFRKLRAKGMHVTEAIDLLSERDFYCADGQVYHIGAESIRKIVYPEIRKKR